MNETTSAVSAASVPAPLGASAARGVGWLTAQTWVVKLGGFLTVVILARLLTPSDFGVVAIAMAVLPLVYLLSDLGFGTFLVQTPHLHRTVVNTAFWYSAVSGVVLGALLVAAAPALEALFGVPGAAAVIVGISPAVVLVSLAAVPLSLMRRAMRFRTISLQAAAAALVGQIVAVVLAAIGAGVWALVVQVTVAQAITVVVVGIASGWRPDGAPRWSDFREMAGFGSGVVGVEIVSLIRAWAERAIVSNALGAAALGQLSVAQRLVQTSQELSGAALTPVSMVVFAQVREDRARLQRGYDRALSLTYLLMPPALTAVAITAPVLVPFLFGPQWAPSVAAAQGLAIAAVFTTGAVLDHGLFYGLGRPVRWLLYALLVDAITVGATLYAVRFGITGVAIGFVLVAAAATVVRWFLVARAIGVRTWAVARRTLAVVLVVAGSGGAGWLVSTLSAGLPPLVFLLFVGAAVLVVHVGLSFFAFRGALGEFGRMLRTRLGRRRTTEGAAS